MDIKAFYNELDELFRKNQIAQVEPFLLNRQVQANQEHDIDASLAIINELIGFYRSQERYEEAIRVTEQALELCKSEYRLGTIAHATTLLNGATAYRFAGQPQKALELFAQTEAIYKEQVSMNDEHFAGLFNNMSAAYAEVGQSDKAVEYLLRAAAIMDALPEHVIESAVTHANLAALYYRLNNGYGAKREIATACSILDGRLEYIAQLQQFRAMQQMFDKLPN